MPNRNPTTRFGRGQSGNPGGDPKGTSLVARLREELNEPAVDGSPVTRGHQLAAALVDRAVAGDVSAIKLVFAYINVQPIARSERGDPGSFEDPLEDIPIDQLRKALMRITCRRTPTPGRPEVC